MYSSVAAAKSLKWAAASSLEPLPVVKPAEPTGPAVGPGFGLWPRTWRVADPALQCSGPTVVEAEPGQMLAPMD